MVSADAFTVDEVSRYAGARDDPARMAQNFTGVLGSTGLRNDIVIRGGSPTELLWRIDGIEIPNPNHFATQGGTGGPVNAINTNLLANSDFLTGAFPAEYGGRLSGVFDLRTSPRQRRTLRGRCPDGVCLADMSTAARCQNGRGYISMEIIAAALFGG